MEFGRFAAENRAIREKANQKRSNSRVSRTSGKGWHNEFMLIERPPGSDDSNSAIKKTVVCEGAGITQSRTGKMARRVVQGYLNYHSVPGNFHHAEVQDT